LLLNGRELLAHICLRARYTQQMLDRISQNQPSLFPLG
jgi:hypothetical protein